MRAAIVGISLTLLGAACGQGGASESDIADEESGGSDTGTIERCEDQVTESACAELTAPPDGDDWRCAWVDVSRHTATCEAVGTTESRCVTLNFVGAGCGEAFACGAENPTGGQNSYIREVGEADFESFLLQTCEYQPYLLWDQCVWDEESAEIYPHEACACSC
jgi:hypothetical protein